jgi:hypothetical protein
MIPVYVHTGLVKTGSTFLQECVFPHLDTIHYYRKEVARAGLKLMFDHTRPPDPTSARAKQLRKLIERARCPILLSDEKLSGHPGLKYEDFTKNLAALKAYIPQAHIIFIVRRQDDFFQSLYGHAVAKGWTEGVEEFLNLNAFAYTAGAAGRSSLVSPTDYRCLNLDAMVEGYFAAFGRERVQVLPYELLKRDPEQFLARLCSFMRCQFKAWHLISSRRNVGPGRWSLRSRLFANRLHASPTWNGSIMRRLACSVVASTTAASGRVMDLLRELPASPLAPEGRSRIRQSYKESNNRLKELLGDEFEQFGY